jgi:hypothetical protein
MKKIDCVTPRSAYASIQKIGKEDCEKIDVHCKKNEKHCPKSDSRLLRDY